MIELSSEAEGMLADAFCCAPGTPPAVGRRARPAKQTAEVKCAAYKKLQGEERVELEERVARGWPLIPPPRPRAVLIRRPSLNALGEPIAATPERIAAFWRWFGDSVVVDEQGRPFVMYVAGTSTVGPLIEFNGRGAGYCFGSLPSARNAIGAADRYGGEPLVVGAYFKLLRPVILDRGLLPDGTRWRNSLPDRVKMRIARRYRDAGHDGGVSGVDGVFFRGCVFEPVQIKAAENVGAFDPLNSDIYA